MSKRTTQELTQSFLEYLSTRQLDKLAELFADSVDWDIPGDANHVPWLGKRKSSQHVREFFELLWPNTEPIDASVYKILTDGNYAVIIGDFSTRMLATGKTVESFFCIQLTFANDKIVRYRVYEDSWAVSLAMR